MITPAPGAALPLPPRGAALADWRSQIRGACWTATGPAAVVTVEAAASNDAR
jgi:hypothetical protein